MPSPHHVVVLLPCQGTAFPQYHDTTKSDIWVRKLDALPSKSALRFQVLGPMWSIRNVNAKRRSKGVQEVGQNVAGQTREALEATCEEASAHASKPHENSMQLVAV